MKTNNIHHKIKANISIPAIKSITRNTSIVLFILWVGTSFLTGLMVFRWLQDNKNPVEKDGIPRNLFIDDVLLSSGDVELKNTGFLVNITLNSNTPLVNNEEKQTIKYLELSDIEASKKIVYDNILKQKINKAHKKYEDGFCIKPLPE